jgi:hypothetical protein
MNQLILALNHNKIYLPDNILHIIYYYSRPRLSNVRKIQIQNNGKAKMALNFVNNYVDEWDNIINLPVPEENYPNIRFTLSEYLKCIPIDIDERINLRHDISQCQCCVRHYGKQTNENIKKIGKPIIKGEKPDFGEIYTLNPRFKRFGTTCTCNCRHVARFLDRSILNQI